jgi:hypothetical protein
MESNAMEWNTMVFDIVYDTGIDIDSDACCLWWLSVFGRLYR